MEIPSIAPPQKTAPDENSAKAMGDPERGKLVVWPAPNNWRLRWQVSQQLPAGGQGDTSIVVSLEDSSLKGVLKCLKKRSESYPKARRRMFQEVANLKVLHGAGAKVPSVIEDGTAMFETRGPMFFVMELIEGKMLSKIVEENLLTLEIAIGIVFGLCETLKYALKEGIIHRDIKPENIIVRRLSPVDVVMVDFGIAHSETDDSNLTDVGESFDNKFVSLPERRGPGENKRDPRSDLTGLCAILHYCLTKCVPRDLQDSSGRLPHHRSGYTLEAVVPNEVQRAFLDAFFDRGFSWELDARFQSLDEFTKRLTEVLSPPGSVPLEDLAVIAARESARLRKCDRTSQLADFRQPIQQFREQWNTFVAVVASKLVGSRFYVHQSNYQPVLDGSGFGDKIESLFVQVGVHNHREVAVLGYHFCSTGEECAIVRKGDYCGQMTNPPQFEPIGEPITVARYTGDTAPPFELLKKDVESGVATLIAHLRSVIERKVGGDPAASLS